MELQIKTTVGKVLNYKITDHTPDGMIYFQDIHNACYKISQTTAQVYDLDMGEWRHMKNFSNMIEKIDII